MCVDCSRCQKARLCQGCAILDTKSLMNRSELTGYNTALQHRKVRTRHPPPRFLPPPRKHGLCVAAAFRITAREPRPRAKGKKPAQGDSCHRRLVAYVSTDSAGGCGAESGRVCTQLVAVCGFQAAWAWAWEGRDGGPFIVAQRSWPPCAIGRERVVSKSPWPTGAAK